MDAGRGRAVGVAFQLRRSGGAGRQGPPAADDPRDRERGAGDPCRASSRRFIRGCGRPSIPPEKLLRAMLLQAFYSIRSERQLMERLEYDLLFRWFVGLGVDDAVWDHSTFSKNRDRLLEGDIAAKFLAAVLAQPRVKRLLVDRSLLGRRHADRGLGVDEELAAEGRLGRAAGAGGGRNAEADFHGQKRSNETHASTTDPEARLYRKGHGQGGQALLHGACADGEPQRPRRRRLSDRSERPCRADRGAAHDRAARRPAERGSRSAPTRPTTPRTSSTSCAR